ncbi:hypothetical protein ACL6C3_07835 [Capilliphycus salinus ALCB114379]|uniref:hypothetical protein n=1 Tax=Capilliphycus salinus TaxID=2768948 RepID=UPI0039A777C1
MKNLSYFLTITLASLTLLSLSSCNSGDLEAESSKSAQALDEPTQTQPSTSTNLTSQTSPKKSEKPTATPPVLKEATAPTNTIPINIYRVDSECSNLVAEPVTVPLDGAVEAAVAKTLEMQSGFELPLNYRVTVDPDYQIAVIDLRVPPSSRRSLYSLSACEQFTLFQTLRETLTGNPDLKIQDVYFTNLGEDLVL